MGKHNQVKCGQTTAHKWLWTHSTRSSMKPLEKLHRQKMGKEQLPTMRDGQRCNPQNYWCHYSHDSVMEVIKPLCSLTMVEKGTKFCVNRGKNWSAGQQIREAEENHLSTWTGKKTHRLAIGVREGRRTPNNGMWNLLTLPSVRETNRLSIPIVDRPSATPTNNGITKVAVSKREWWHMALPPWLNVQHSPSLSFGNHAPSQFSCANIASWVI